MISAAMNDNANDETMRCDFNIIASCIGLNGLIERGTNYMGIKERNGRKAGESLAKADAVADRLQKFGYLPLNRSTTASGQDFGTEAAAVATG
jgi:hypothetical protein